LPYIYIYIYIYKVFSKHRVIATYCSQKCTLSLLHVHRPGFEFNTSKHGLFSAVPCSSLLWRCYISASRQPFMHIVKSQELCLAIILSSPTTWLTAQWTLCSPLRYGEITGRVYSRLSEHILPHPTPVHDTFT